MNREQMIAWLTLEGVVLNKAPIIGAEGSYVWAARDGEDELQRYMDKPDTWDRYVDYVYCENRIPARFEELGLHPLYQLYKSILADREQREERPW
jgi:hypothetical protein